MKLWERLILIGASIAVFSLSLGMFVALLDAIHNTSSAVSFCGNCSIFKLY